MTSTQRVDAGPVFTPGLWVWAGLVVLITVGSLLPVGNLPQTASLISDKIQHVGGYALLAVAACSAARLKRVVLLLLGLSLLIGVGIEYLQPLTGRMFEYMDIVANGAGLCAGMALFRGFQGLKKKLIVENN
ncbi:VanZ family protein [Sneathiella chinensis]|nr:VanZ family protein [Sneathiella chinensis]